MKINVKDVLVRPADNSFVKSVNIMGKNYAGIFQAPNVYVVESNDAINVILNNDKIEFEQKTKTHTIAHTLKNCSVHNTEKPNIILIECETWSEKYEDE